MEKLYKIKDKVVRFLAVAAGLVVVAQMLLTCCDVFARNILKSTVPGAYEITQYVLMPLAIFLALPAAYDAGIMPRIDDIIKRLSPPLKKAAYAFIFIVEVIIYALLSYCGVRFAINGFQTRKGVTMAGGTLFNYPLYIVVPIGFAMVLILSVMFYIKFFTKKDEEEKEK